MIVVSDTSCIGYLIIIDKLNLLKENFSEVVVPNAVHQEILQLSVAYDLKQYLKADYIISKSITNHKLYYELLTRLDTSESEAIVLSPEIQADLLLIDKRKGTLFARSLGLKTIGLIGVLLLSKERKLIPSVKPVFDQLITNTSFRITKILYSNILKQANEQ